jgi:hypothetical protein
MEILNKGTHNFDLRSVKIGRRNVQLVDICSATTPLLNGVSDFSFVCFNENREGKTVVTHGQFL